MLLGLHDFVSETNTELEIGTDMKNLSHCISLINDFECEIIDEHFVAILQTSAFGVTVDPTLDRAMITINDTSEPECGEWSSVKYVDNYFPYVCVVLTW